MWQEIPLGERRLGGLEPNHAHALLRWKLRGLKRNGGGSKRVVASSVWLQTHGTTSGKGLRAATRYREAPHAGEVHR
jgi:hypothetical protein